MLGSSFLLVIVATSKLKIGNLDIKNVHAQ